MFAGKFRSWMEAHLGRPRKKQQKKDSTKPAPGLARAEPLYAGGRASAGSSGSGSGLGPGLGRQESPPLLTDLPASSHLHRGPLTAESLDSISTCPTTGSERGGSLRPHVNLSSPESAYSTGYSTDGTSPGASFPPEYYINLRSGTHYFQSQLPPGLPLPLPLHLPVSGPASLPPGGGSGSGLPLHLPPGLPPLPPALQPALHQPHLATLHSRQTWAWPTGLVQQPDPRLEARAEPPPPRLSFLTPGRSRKQQQQQQQQQQILLEQQQQQLHFLQQQHQHQQHLLHQQQQLYHKHQQQQQHYLNALSRTGSSTEEDLVGKARPTSASSSTLSSHSAASSSTRPAAQHWQPTECVASPRARERTRIRTNPWLPTSPAPTPTATPTPRTRNQQPPPQQPLSNRQGLGGCSSSLSLSSSSSYGSASDVSLQRRPGPPGRARARHTPQQPLFQLNEESPSVEDKPLPAQPSPRRSSPAAPPSCAPVSGRVSRAANRVTGRPAGMRVALPGRSSSGSSTSSASSRTANNGSPPNFSDNDNNEEDVTLNEMMGKFDESYVYEKETDILSDSDPTDVEDYGDDGGDEQTEEDHAEDELDFIDRGSLPEICDDGRGLLVNRGHCTFHNFPPGRRLSSRQRGSRRDRDRDREGGAGSGSRTPIDRRKKRSVSARPRAPVPVPVPVESELAAGANLNRIVMQRLLLRGEGGTGTRSAGNTPLSARRNERCQVHPQHPHPPYPMERTLADADREADRKYRQLIMQAEHILVSMSGSPLPVRAPHYGTPPMTKRLPIGHLNRRLDLLKQGASPPTMPAKTVLGRPLCPSPLARRDCDRVGNDNAEENRNRWSPHIMPRRAMENRCFTPSPTHFRRAGNDNDYFMNTSRSSNPTPTPTPPPDASPMSTPGGRRRGPPPIPPPRTISVPKPTPVVPAPAKEPEPRMSKPFELNLKPLPPKGWTAIEASSSDSDGSVTPHLFDRRAKSTATTPTSSRPPLVTYKSVDHRLDSIDTCPQSEPVKRKVYAGSHTLDRLSKKLENTQIMPRTPTTPVPDEDAEEERRREVLMQTLQQLKHSLESQSASLQAPG